MTLDVTYSKSRRLLTVKLTQSGKPEEIIKMEAHSGGWDGYKPLPRGKWLIVENPTGNRHYFGLFYQDGRVNDQFKHNDAWRDGIRFGFHDAFGSHGCVMAKAAPGQSVFDAHKNWQRIQELIRTKRPRKVVSYQNNENPKVNDNTKYHVSSYGNLNVVE